jgi:hypothetical protein
MWWTLFLPYSLTILPIKNSLCHIDTYKFAWLILGVESSTLPWVRKNSSNILAVVIALLPKLSLIYQYRQNGPNPVAVRSKRRSEAVWMLELLRAWTFVWCVCCVLCRWQPLRQTDHWFRGVLLGVWLRLIVCDLETLTTGRTRRDLGCRAEEKINKNLVWVIFWTFSADSYSEQST